MKFARAARRSRGKRMTVCSKLPVKMADLRHVGTIYKRRRLGTMSGRGRTLRKGGKRSLKKEKKEY